MDSAEKTQFPCENCGRLLKSKGGYTNHLKKCKLKTVANSVIEIDHKHSVVSNANDPDPGTNDEIPFVEETFHWGERKGSDFTDDLNIAYKQIVFWRQNLFLLPSGKYGKKFIREITRVINCWVDDTALKSVALKPIMVMPALLLQKTSQTSKLKDLVAALSHGLDLWEQGNLKELLFEGQSIQSQLKRSKKTLSTNDISKQFVKKMANGNVSGAIKLLSRDMENGIPPLNDETLSLLKQKYPHGKDSVLLPDAPIKVHDFRFEAISSEMIRESALKTRDGAGPSGLNGDG